jgi:hypothetical protein
LPAAVVFKRAARMGGRASAELRLSPGDLDQAVAALLAFARIEGGTGGTAFERIASYREGVLNGLPGCA